MVCLKLPPDKCHNSRLFGIITDTESRKTYEVHMPSVQAILLDSFYGTERGLNVSSEARAEISELITQLEAKTPNPAATEAGSHCLSSAMK